MVVVIALERTETGSDLAIISRELREDIILIDYEYYIKLFSLYLVFLIEFREIETTT